MNAGMEIFETSYGRFYADTVADAKITEALKCGRHHQADTIEVLNAFISAESVVVDAGAHIGTIAIPLAKKARKVVAYEPDSMTFDTLRLNNELNAANLDLRNVGLGRHASRGNIVPVREGNAGAHTLTVGEGSVPIVALDDELPAFDILKIDVEGMELSVLEGARRIIEEARPVVLFEVNLSQLRSHGAELNEIESYFSSRNYDLFLPLRVNGKLSLSKIHSLLLVTLCTMPGALVFRRTSSTFDVLALPRGKKHPFQVMSGFYTVWLLVLRNIKDKINRLKRIIYRTTS